MAAIARWRATTAGRRGCIDCAPARSPGHAHKGTPCTRAALSSCWTRRRDWQKFLDLPLVLGLMGRPMRTWFGGTRFRRIEGCGDGWRSGVSCWWLTDWMRCRKESAMCMLSSIGELRIAVVVGSIAHGQCEFSWDSHADGVSEEEARKCSATIRLIWRTSYVTTLDFGCWKPYTQGGVRDAQPIPTWGIYKAMMITITWWWVENYRNVRKNGSIPLDGPSVRVIMWVEQVNKPIMMTCTWDHLHLFLMVFYRLASPCNPQSWKCSREWLWHRVSRSPAILPSTWNRRPIAWTNYSRPVFTRVHGMRLCELPVHVCRWWRSACGTKCRYRRLLRASSISIWTQPSADENMLCTISYSDDWINYIPTAKWLFIHLLDYLE